MTRIIIYSASLFCSLTCIAMESPSQNKQTVAVIEKDDEGNQKYDEAIRNLAIDPNQALRLLREAEVLGHMGAHKKLDEIRKSEAFKNPNSNKNQAGLGALLRKLEPSSKDLYMLGCLTMIKILRKLCAIF